MALSIIMITKNAAGVVGEVLGSIEGLWDELLIDDDGSTDGMQKIVKRYRGVVTTSHEKNLGQRKQALVAKAKGPWVLVLDSDERVSEELREEIKRLKDGKMGRQKGVHTLDPRFRGDDKKGSGDDKKIVAYRIPYQNYVFGRPVYYSGEKYAKVRLFRKGFARISPEALHEEVIVKDGKVGELKGVIHHHSYRTPWHLFSKFTKYAWVAAGMMKKNQDGFRVKPGMTNKVTLKKLFLYGPHMFWARYFKEKGYKDGWRGLVLALAFGYMEGLTYWFSLV